MKRRALSRGGLPSKAGRLALALACAAFGYAAYVYLTLPDVAPLQAANPKTTAFMELRDREAHDQGRPSRREQRWVSYARISPALKRAVLVAEDAAFWRHEGIDVDEIRKSLERDLERRQFSRGGSTITQQLAKNLYLSPAKNPLRKLKELLIARRLEAQLSKRRILELYLNVIEWGDGLYGAEAASRAYFGKPASALSPDEAALLAAAIVNPRVLDPQRPSARLLRRQRLILSRMGAVTPPPDASPAAAASPGALPAAPAEAPAGGDPRKAPGG
ncbi:MAG: mrcA 3 [Acidobacteria bacterium]|nr:mrcA 3 [Acidobacteriota bacterium]